MTLVRLARGPALERHYSAVHGNAYDNNYVQSPIRGAVLQQQGGGSLPPSAWPRRQHVFSTCMPHTYTCSIEQTSINLQYIESAIARLSSVYRDLEAHARLT